MLDNLLKYVFLAAKGLRSMQIKNYLMFYIVREESKAVNVIRFIHARRDWVKLFDESMFDDL